MIVSRLGSCATEQGTQNSRINPMHFNEDITVATQWFLRRTFKSRRWPPLTHLEGKQPQLQPESNWDEIIPTLTVISAPGDLPSKQLLQKASVSLRENLCERSHKSLPKYQIVIIKTNAYLSRLSTGFLYMETFGKSKAIQAIDRFICAVRQTQMYSRRIDT